MMRASWLVAEMMPKSELFMVATGSGLEGGWIQSLVSLLFVRTVEDLIGSLVRLIGQRRVDARGDVDAVARLGAEDARHLPVVGDAAQRPARSIRQLVDG